MPKERSKNGKEHEVPLSAATVAILTAIPRIDGCDAVFTVNGRGAIQGLYLVKHRLDKLLPGMATWQYRDLRRSFATGCARLGVALPTIEKLLNHTGGSFAGLVRVYQRHGFADEKRAAIETWARHIEQLMTGKANSNIVSMRGRS